MKWISAGDLERWADTKIGRDDVARLIGLLICASAPRVGAFRFPSGDAAGIPGYDGYLIAEGVPPYVPDGESVWEFGTGHNYLAKANEDYDRRTAAPGCIELAKATFVFVTLRQWSRDKPTLTDWEKAKSSESKWKAVRALDAISLEHWLERNPAVAKDVGRNILGFVPETGVRSIGEYWVEYAARFRPQLIENAVLCERKEAASDLLQQLISGGPRAIRLQADSTDEVLAFVAATIRTADASTRAFLEARTLIVEAQEAARQYQGRPDLIFLPRGAALDPSGPLSYAAPTVISVARDEQGASLLRRPSYYALEQELQKMGITEPDAHRLARECGRSVTILARRIPSGKAPEPPWQKTRNLVPAILAGSWNATNEHDKEAIAGLAGQKYDDFEDSMVPFLADRDPLEREGEVWKVRAPIEAFERLGSLLTSRDLERLRQVAMDVFGEVDPALDLTPDERVYASLHRKIPRYSEWLRDGLAATLLHLGVLHEQARVTIPGSNPEQFVEQLIADLPGLKENARLLMSLQARLPILMEAAPRPLLEALEQLLGGDGTGILPFFEESSSPFSGSPHTGLLWALEMLAWDPELLLRVATDLAALARIDPGGHLANRPIRSLSTIFTPWLPQTYASTEQRLAAIDDVIRREPEIGWQLVLTLLPAHQDTVMPTPRPRLREAGASKQQTLTRELVHTTYREVVNRAIALASTDLDRTVSLVRTMAPFTRPEMLEICNRLRSLIGSIPSERRMALWDELRKLVSMHTTHQEAQWAFPAEIREELDGIVRDLEPANALLRTKWLFDQFYPDLPEAPSGSRVDAVEEARLAAVRRLYAEAGDRGVLELAGAVKFPGLVALPFATILERLERFDEVLVSAFASNEAVPELFAIALSGAAHTRFGPTWSLHILDLENMFSPQQLATLLLGFGEEHEAWDLAAKLGAEIVHDYWTRRLPFPVKGKPAEFERAAREYLNVNRPLAALQSVSRAAERIPVCLVFEILDASLAQVGEASKSAGVELAYEIEQVFEKLSSRPDIDESELAKREFQYLPLLTNHRSGLTLHRIMAKDASFFASVLCTVFKRASGGDNEPSPEAITKAKYAYELLSNFKLVPGLSGGAEGVPLEHWVKEVRRIAQEQDRARIGDHYIGQILAHAPNDPEDHAWPHRRVREVLESEQSNEIEKGVRMGRSNMAGVHAIDPKNPAALEHHLASQAREWSRIVARWPRTSAMLIMMVEHWEGFAGVLERRARQDDLREY